MAGDEETKPSATPREAVTAGDETQGQKDARFRKLYSTPPDFKQVAALDPDFAAV